MSNPLLGWIEPKDRTPEQEAAHHAATRKMLASSAIPAATLNKGDRVILTDSWKHPAAVADIGFEFTGFRQLTGSCVGVSEGNLITTLACIQSALNQTKAFVCFWPFPYGRTRYNEGDRGQGEGAVDSVMDDTITKEGYFDIGQQGLPTFDHSDGLALPSRTELAWSDGGSSLVKGYMTIASQHKGATAKCNNAQDIANAIANGYPVIDGCSNYVGSGTIKGDHNFGHYDGRGGHSTCFLGVWNHPNDGMLYLYSNQWDGSTYPDDPAGAGRCCCWISESEVTKAFNSYGMDGGECFCLSHVDWFPAQPKVLDSYV